MAETGDAAVVPTHFPFLRLPREIRDMVYGYALDLSIVFHPFNRVDIGKSGTIECRYDHKASCDHKTTPGILLLSRRIYKEASGVLYQQPLFLNIADNDYTTAWVLFSCCSKTLLERVQNVTLKMPAADFINGPYWEGVTALLGLAWSHRHNIRCLKVSIDDFDNWSTSHILHMSKHSTLLNPFEMMEGIPEVDFDTGAIPFKLMEPIRRDLLQGYNDSSVNGNSSAYHTKRMEQTKHGLEHLAFGWVKFCEWWSLADQKGPYKRNNDLMKREE